MASNTIPIAILTPKSPQVRISTANTNRDGTGTLGTLSTVGTNGAFYKGIRIVPEVSIPAGDIVRIFLQALGAGNYELMKELSIPAWNPAASGAGAPPIPQAPDIEWMPPEGIVLAGTDVIKASTDLGKTYSVRLVGGGEY